jgi:hypothetical protein
MYVYFLFRTMEAGKEIGECGIFEAMIFLWKNWEQTKKFPLL